MTRGTVVLDAERCKGCGLCVPACRPGVLSLGSTMNHAGFNLPELREGCTGCMACAEICPDFALEVWKFEVPIPMGASTTGADSVGTTGATGADKEV